MTPAQIPDDETMQALLGLHPHQIAIAQALANGNGPARPEDVGAPPSRVISTPSASPRGISVPPPAPAEGSTEALEARVDQPRQPMGPVVPSQQDTDQAEFNRLKNSGSGIEQWAGRHGIGGQIVRGLAGVGSALAPGIASAIPGTDLHHERLLQEQAGRLKQDVGQQAEEATTAHTQAETGAIPTHTKLEEAEIVKDLRPPEKLEDEGKTVTTDSGVQQWDPATKRYDIPVGEAAVKTPPHITYDSGIPVSVTQGKKIWDINDPNLPPELKPVVDAAQRAHGQHVQEQKAIQASGQGASEARLNQTEDFQKSEKGKEHLTKVEGDYTDAASKADLIRDAIRQAQAGNKMAGAYQGMLATLGMTTMEGVKRVNAVELGIPTSAGSLWDRVQNKVGKWTAGQPMDKDLQKDLSQLADTMQKAAYKKYQTNHANITKRYGLKDETPLAEPQVTGGGETGGGGGGGAGSSGKTVSLAAAKQLPINKGKSDDAIRKDIEAHGHKVVD